MMSLSLKSINIYNKMCWLMLYARVEYYSMAPRYPDRATRGDRTLPGNLGSVRLRGWDRDQGKVRPCRTHHNPPGQGTGLRSDLGRG